MNKISRFYYVATMLLMTASSLAASLPPLCEHNTNAMQCKLVWSSDNPDGFKSSQVHSDDDHVHQVYCTPRPEAGLYTLNDFSEDNKTLTIHYLGLKHTCYTRIDDIINKAYGNVNHGYIEATILVNSSSVTLPTDNGRYYSRPGGEEQLWPAFFLSGANWPTQGEIDIAEGFNSTTRTYLHGEDVYTDQSSINGVPIGPPDGVLGHLYDHQQPHTYGLEWQLVGDNQIILNTYYDGVLQYTSQLQDATRSPYSQIKKGLQNGTMSVTFDADQGPSNLFTGWAGDIRYSMTVYHVNVYSIDTLFPVRIR